MAGSAPGCGTGRRTGACRASPRSSRRTPVIDNPLVVPSATLKTSGTRRSPIVDKYFDIESENRLSRTIRTQPQMGATMLEPWALDSATFQDRFEASLQTIRRLAIIHVDPAPTGGFRVKVEVYKFLEDLSKPDKQAAGRAGLQQRFPGQSHP